ncbi:MAG: hypothetical protein C0599_03880 [Salinivirgaceae bacterium]|nr:MAG: hypothetical protein C0599_03880 [Salinivirgaceae bacterium]
MKNKYVSYMLLSCIALFSLNLSTNAQNVIITDDESNTPHTSAMLDVQSLNKGFLMPRLTQAQRNAILSPAEGLIIYQTDNTSGIYIYQSGWKLLGGDLGYHMATQNLALNNNWLSNDGDDEGIFINDIGNVGIGTNNPVHNLSVMDTTEGGYADIAVGISGGTRQPYVRLYVDDTLQDAGSWGLRHSWSTLGGQPFRIINGGNTQFTIIRGGYVGIGVVNPTAKLQVLGNAIIGDSMRNWNEEPGVLELAIRHPWYFGQLGSGDNSQLSLHPTFDGAGFFIQSQDQGWDYAFGVVPKNVNSESKVIMIPDGGTVGIGTNDPTSTLTVNGSIYGAHNATVFKMYDATGWSKFVFGNTTTDADAVTLFINGYDGDASGSDYAGITHYGSSAENYRMSIGNNIGPITLQETGGNVGIGTTNPDYKLTVVGGNAGISVSGGNDGDRLLEFNTDRPWYFEQEGDDAGTHLRLREYAVGSKSFWVDASGNFGVRSQDGSAYKFIVNSLGIGIGTTNILERLTVDGNIRMQSSGAARIIMSAQSGYNLIYSYSSLPLVLNSAGNVGVGTTTPAAKLSVQADASTGDTLFSVKDKEGNNVFVVYPDAVQVIVPTDTKGGTRHKRGAFVVSGRGTSKATQTNFMDMTKENYFLGYDAGQSVSTGNYNQIMGYESGYTMTTGMNNTFIGYRSGYLTENGIGNVFIGKFSGYSNLGSTNLTTDPFSGNYNVFVGENSGYYNSRGAMNVFLGNYAGYRNTTARNNTYIGTRAGLNNTNSSNVFIGSDVCYSGTSAGECVFIGKGSGYKNSGIGNVFIGNASGYNSTSSYSVFIGHDAGFNETNSNKLYIDNSSTSSPLIYGDFNSNYLSINGRFRVFANYADYCGIFVNDGNSNYRYGLSIQTGTDNNSGTNYMVRFADGDNSPVGYITSSGGVVSYGTKSATPNKSNVASYKENAVSILKKIDVIYFHPSNELNNKTVGFNGKQIKDLIPGSTFYEKETDEYYTDRSAIVPILTKAIQEQQMEIEITAKENKELKKTIQELTVRMETIEKYLKHKN